MPPRMLVFSLSYPLTHGCIEYSILCNYVEKILVHMLPLAVELLRLPKESYATIHLLLLLLQLMASCSLNKWPEQSRGARRAQYNKSNVELSNILPSK